MKVHGLTWLGTRSEDFEAMTDFAENVLGLQRSFGHEGVAGFELPDGSLFEIFAPGVPAGGHPESGVVGGFMVDDVRAARDKLEAAGLEVGEIQTAGGPGGWLYFRAPDGNLYEIISGA
jgi:catechol 2,3-dioxygenase-like lactoylglutathione lyase family enzyme